MILEHIIFSGTFESLNWLTGDRRQTKQFCFSDADCLVLGESQSRSRRSVGKYPVKQPRWEGETLIHIACVHGSTNGTNDIPISFKVLPMVPLVIPLVPMVPFVKTIGSQYCRQPTVWAKLPSLESHMIQYGVLNFKFINLTNKLRFY